MQQQPSIFREEALERLSSPEQLDQVMHVTPLRAWLALIALAVVVVAAVVWGILGTIPIEVSGQGLLLGQDGLRRLLAPTDGVVTEHRRGGDTVHKGDVVVRIQDKDGKSVDVVAEQDSVVVETYVHTGFPVQAGSPVANIEPRASDLQAVLFIPVADGKRVAPGMAVHVSPATASSDQYGVLLGHVVYVSPFPTSTMRLQALLADSDLVQYFSRGGPSHEVAVELDRDPSTPTGFRWSSGSGPPVPLTAGTLASADIVLGQSRPLGLVLPVFDQ